jgi:hypothetical protein
MDTYRTNTTPEAMRREGEKALAEIAEFKPDLVFANDDAADAQVMMPLIGRSDVAVVFSGMNGQPEMYNESKHYMDSRAHPGSNVVGVYEKLYAAQALKVMVQAVPGLVQAKAVMITDYSPTGNGLTKQFELELNDGSAAGQGLGRIHRTDPDAERRSRRKGDLPRGAQLAGT